MTANRDLMRRVVSRMFRNHALVSPLTKVLLCPLQGKTTGRKEQEVNNLQTTAVGFLMMEDDQARRLEMQRQTRTPAFWLARSTRRNLGSTDAAISTYCARSIESSKSYAIPSPLPLISV